MAAHGVHLQIDNVIKDFGTHRVLQGVTLESAPGAFIAIVGKSGCGKSTLLRLIAGLDSPTEGSIQMDGRIVTGIPPMVRYMFQEARLLPWKRVFDNVALGLPHKDRARAEQALEQVGLKNRARDWPAVLSGGQRQRVALARALASAPRMLLLDEPLGALDALTRMEMQQLLETLWQEQQFTALLVTHDVEEAVALADRVILIEEGAIAAEYDIDLPRPRNHGSLAFASLKTTILDRVMERQPLPERAPSSYALR